MRDSLARFAGTAWSLSPDVLIRTSGFPVQGLANLADTGLADEADTISAQTPMSAWDAAFRAIWERSTGELARRLADIAARDDFRLAITWQNGALLDTALDPLLRAVERGEARDRRQRSKERLIAAYWQRYCAKNDSIGFFGPVAWGRIEPLRASTSVSVGPALVERAETLLEYWSVDALARVLQNEFDLARWLRPRRVPTLALGRDHVTDLDGRTVRVDAVDLALLAAADGSATADLLSSRLSSSAVGRTSAELYGRLVELKRRGWLIWRLELPVSCRSEDDLRALLAQVSDESIRNEALARLDRLVDARRNLQKSWNNPQALRESLRTLDDTFHELTEKAASRLQGQTYAGRTLAYLECRRHLALELGEDVLVALRPLSMLLDSIRWLTYRIRQMVVPIIAAAHQRLLSRGTELPNAAMLWRECVSRHLDLDRAVDEAVVDYQAKWQRLIPGEEGTSRIQLAAEEIEAEVRAAFHAPRSGWTAARWCSPDIMIVNGDGDWRLVVGEIHPAMNTTDYAASVRHHDDLASLLAQVDRVAPAPRLIISQAYDMPARLRSALVRDQDLSVVALPHLPPDTRGRPVVLADIPVVERDGCVELLVNGDRFDAVDVFEPILRERILRRFKRAPQAHRPRVTVDRLVFFRESWTCRADQLPFPRLRTDMERFLGARQWWREHRLPRHVFVAAPAEPKPIFVDFASPVYVELLCEIARRAARTDGEASLTFTEMLPSPEETWLCDAQGRRYTSEIRLVLVDGLGVGQGGQEEGEPSWQRD